MIIGVASVIALVSIGEGARKEVIDNYESIGTNILRLYMNRWDTKITLDQVVELEQRVPDMEMAMPVVNWWAEVTYEGKRSYASVMGVTEIFPQIRDHNLYAGRFFSAVEVEIYRPVAVIGWQVAQDMFAGRNPQGKYVYMDQIPLR